MNRRTVLIGAGIALSPSAAGCLDSGSATLEDDKEPPSELIAEELQILERSDWDTVPELDEPPAITTKESNSQVIIEGKTSYGGSNCNEVSLSETDYDATEGALTVTVSIEPISTADDCHADIVEEAYRVILEFDKSIPATIEANEYGDDYQFEKTEP
ncbi:hypothetical protein [Natrononativus amylolyticus]|uniref:hypothetical protein n=1 Tax=Natrononativus amylolyticus TaxID=2963434 RepID=UPI0020CE73D3|nr:hypothetical protein [Natrononativus amylolyticus]